MSNFRVVRMDSTDRTRFCPHFNTAILEDTRLTADARLMLVYLLSRGDGWEHRQENIMKIFAWSKNKVCNLSTQLEAAGYLSKHIRRGSGGKMAGCDWVVYEDASLNPEISGKQPDPKKPESREPDPKKPESRKLGTYKEQVVIKNKGINNKPLPADAGRGGARSKTGRKNEQASNPAARKVVAHLVEKLKEQGAKGSEFHQGWLFPCWAVADRLLKDHTSEELCQAIDFLCGQSVYPARNMADIERNLSVWRKRTQPLVGVGQPQTYEEIDPIFKGGF